MFQCRIFQENERVYLNSKSSGRRDGITGPCISTDLGPELKISKLLLLFDEPIRAAAGSGAPHMHETPPHAEHSYRHRPQRHNSFAQLSLPV
jgi:hypothetical protein